MIHPEHKPRNTSQVNIWEHKPGKHLRATGRRPPASGAIRQRSNQPGTMAKPPLTARFDVTCRPRIGRPGKCRQAEWSRHPVCSADEHDHHRAIASELHTSQ